MDDAVTCEYVHRVSVNVRLPTAGSAIGAALLLENLPVPRQTRFLMRHRK
jgi:hypothetical protein